MWRARSTSYHAPQFAMSQYFYILKICGERVSAINFPHKFSSHKSEVSRIEVEFVQRCQLLCGLRYFVFYQIVGHKFVGRMNLYYILSNCGEKNCGEQGVPISEYYTVVQVILFPV